MAGVQLVSLGCSCATKLAFNEVGCKQETLPFDWMCTLMEGIIGFLRHGFSGFFEYTSIESSQVGPTKFTVYRNVAHSWWHDDPRDPACREKFVRRIKRLEEFQARKTPILFVRILASTNELSLAGTLMDVILQKFGDQSKLLLIIPGQYAPALGPHLIDGMPNLLVHLSSMAGYSDGVRNALNWMSGQMLPNCKRSKSLTTIEGLRPAHTGFFGMGGVPAFENIPDYVARPPRDDGKSNAPETSPTKFPNQTIPSTWHQSCGIIGAQTNCSESMSTTNPLSAMSLYAVKPSRHDSINHISYPPTMVGQSVKSPISVTNAQRSFEPPLRKPESPSRSAGILDPSSPSLRLGIPCIAAPPIVKTSASLSQTSQSSPPRRQCAKFAVGPSRKSRNPFVNVGPPGNGVGIPLPLSTPPQQQRITRNASFTELTHSVPPPLSTSPQQRQISDGRIYSINPLFSLAGQQHTHELSHIRCSHQA